MSQLTFTLEEAIDYIERNDFSKLRQKKLDFLNQLIEEIKSCDGKTNKQLVIRGHQEILKIIFNFSEK